LFEFLTSTSSIEDIYQLDQLPATTLKQALQHLAIPSRGLTLGAADDLNAYRALCSSINDIAYHWPSAGLVAVMHHHVVFALSRYPALFAAGSSLLSQVKASQALVASLSAEASVNKDAPMGNADNAHAYAPLLHRQLTANRLVLNGVKKPASLSHIADFFICVSRDADTRAAAIALIPRSDSVSVAPDLWQIAPLKATDSQSVRFDNVSLSLENISMDEAAINPVMTLAMGAFLCMTMHCYLGIARRLIDKLRHQFKPYYELRASMARITMFSETMMGVIEAQSFKAEEDSQALGFLQTCRHSLERDLSELVTHIYKHMSANALVTDRDFLHLMNTLMMLRFHPQGEKQSLRAFMPSFEL
jgi:hypothetical protein